MGGLDCIVEVSDPGEVRQTHHASSLNSFLDRFGGGAADTSCVLAQLLSRAGRWCGSHIMWLRTRPFPDFAPNRRHNICNSRRSQPSRHLKSAQRGKSTWRVTSALDCQLTSALLHVDFHAVLAHEDVDQDTRRSTNCWNVDRRHSERGKFHPDWKWQDPSRWARVCDIVRSTAIEGVLLARQTVFDKLNKTALDPSSAVGPAKDLISGSMMAECEIPTATPSIFSSSEFSLLEAGDLQAHERNLPCGDTTSGQPIADLIAIGRRQMLVPREHPPDPRPNNFGCAGPSVVDSTFNLSIYLHSKWQQCCATSTWRNPPVERKHRRRQAKTHRSHRKLLFFCNSSNEFKRIVPQILF